MLSDDRSLVTIENSSGISGFERKARPRLSGVRVPRAVASNGHKVRKPPSRRIGGLRFIAGGDGHWYSECGRYAVFHMMRNTVHASWELFTLDESDRPDDMLDTAPALADVVRHALTGSFSERRGWPHEDTAPVDDVQADDVQVDVRVDDVQLAGEGDASFHVCAADGRLVYLPGLDPSASDWSGGARVPSPVSIGSIPNFDYDPRQDGDCWICAYAEALRVGRVEPPRPSGVDEREYVLLRARARLRASHVLATARRTLAEVDAERRAAADAAAPHYRKATPEEVRAMKEEESLSTRLAGLVRQTLEATSLGVAQAQAVAMVAQNAPVKDDVLEIPPEAVSSVAGLREKRKKKKGSKKKFSGEGGGQRNMF